MSRSDETGGRNTRREQDSLSNSKTRRKDGTTTIYPSPGLAPASQARETHYTYESPWLRACTTRVPTHPQRGSRVAWGFAKVRCILKGVDAIKGRAHGLAQVAIFSF